jgi:Flp pilus assembly protein TadD
MRSQPIENPIRKSVIASLRSMVLAIACASVVLAGCAGKRPNQEQVRYNALDPDVVVEEPEPLEATLDSEIAIGDQLRDQGHRSEAVFHYLRGLYLDEASPIPRARVAFLHLDEDPERAQRIFEKLIEDHPRMASAHMGRGLALVAEGHVEQARESLERAVELDPRATTAWIALGMVADRAGDQVAARQYYESALSVDPDRYEVRNNLGVSLLLSGDFEAAAGAFRDAVHLDPRDPVVYNNLGVALGRMRLYKQALDNFRRSSDDADAFNNLGLVCHVNGDYGLAITYFEQSLLLGPSDRSVVLANLEATEVAQFLNTVLR